MFTLVVLFVLIGDKTMHAENVQTTYVCPTNFTAVGKKCYHFSTKEVSWTDSHFHCQLLNGSLTVIDSYRKQHQLRDFLSKKSCSSLVTEEYWIDGIYDWEQRKWKWGSSGQYIHFNKFSRVNLGNKYKWKCIYLDGANSIKWSAQPCTEKNRFICETDGNIFIQFNRVNEKKKKIDISKCSSVENLDKYTKRKCLKLLGKIESNEPAAAYGFRPKPKKVRRRKNINWVCPPHMVLLGSKCYSFSKVQSSWNDAHFECRKNDSKLAIIRTQSQDYKLRLFLNNFIEGQERWIGGIFDWKTETWRWAMTGKPITYEGFHDRAIKRQTPEELSWNSIFMDPKWNNQWNADKQTEKKYFICQIKARAVKNLGHRKKTKPQTVPNTDS